MCANRVNRIRPNSEALATLSFVDQSMLDFHGDCGATSVIAIHTLQGFEPGERPALR